MGAIISALRVRAAQLRSRDVLHNPDLLHESYCCSFLCEGAIALPSALTHTHTWDRSQP